MTWAKRQMRSLIENLGDLAGHDIVLASQSAHHFEERGVSRTRNPDRMANRLSSGDLDLDRETRRVRRGGRDIHLGPTEFRLLEYLMERQGRVFSRAQLLEEVWKLPGEIDERTVDVHIGRLRKSLSRGHERDPIRTVRGTGYTFDETFGKPRL